MVWTLTLPFVDRHPWLVDVQVACDALIVSAIVHLTGGVTSYFASLYTLPIIAASTVQSWRGGLMVTALSSLMYARPRPRAVKRPGCCRSARPDVLPALRVAVFTVGLNVFGFMAVGGAERLPRRGPAAHRRAARAGVVAARRPAGVQPARDRQPDERPDDLATWRGGS